MLAVIATAAFVASLLTLFSGFGLGTLLMPVVAVFFPVVTAVAITAFVHLLNNLFKLAMLWRHIHWPVTLRFGLPALVATIPGAWVLTALSAGAPLVLYTIAGIEAEISPVKLVVGLLLILFALVEWFGIAIRMQISGKFLPLGGLLSGFFGGLSGHQGAFRSIFLLHAGLDTKAFVASNAAIATFVDLTRLAVYGLNLGLLLADVKPGLLAAATLAAFAGVMVGNAGIHKVTIAAVQKLVAV
ncbi:MAG: TSUP family transporter, partial [Pseudomonadota bacterium]|nr:TSUP family transporter [Pseudomonadota bacterium]